MLPWALRVMCSYTVINVYSHTRSAGEMPRAIVETRAWLIYQRIRDGLPIGKLVAETPWVIHAHDRTGRRLLHVAAELQRPEAVFALTNAGASVLDIDFHGNPPSIQNAPHFVRAAAVPPVGFAACSYL